MRVVESLAVLILWVCPSGCWGGNIQAPTSLAPMPHDARQSDVSASNRSADMTKYDSAIHNSLSSLRPLEGQKVVVRGNFRFAGNLTFANSKLVLADGAVVALPTPLESQLLQERDNGKVVTVEGLIFFDVIPERYGIVARSPDPYVLDYKVLFVEP